MIWRVRAFVAIPFIAAGEVLAEATSLCDRVAERLLGLHVVGPREPYLALMGRDEV